MSLTPPPPVTRRDWTLPIIAGVVAIVVVLGVCLAGTATALLSLRRQGTSGPDPTTSTSTAPGPGPGPSAAPTPPNTKPGPQCLIGDWVSTNTTNTAEIYGASVQLTGKGSVARFTADGTYGSIYKDYVASGTASGDTYEVIHNGTLILNYIADDTTIRYSNPSGTGTTTWKVNGKVRNTEPLRATLEPDSYKCQGNQLRLFWDTGASEYQRILPPGVPI